MIKQFYQKHRQKIKRLDGLLTNNTVLERGLVVAPVIVAATSVKNSLILGISFAVITFFTLWIASYVPKKFPYTVRVILYVLTACVLFVPTAMILDFVFPDSIFKVGIFLPLTVTNSLIVTKSETQFLKKQRPQMLLEVFCYSMGFFLTILVVGIIRELIGSGSFYGHPVQFPTLSAAALPFGGFIVVGFLAAAVQRFRIYLQEPDRPRRKRNREDS